jgi:hypothetical protein
MFYSSSSSCLRTKMYIFITLETLFTISKRQKNGVILKNIKNP